MSAQTGDTRESELSRIVLNLTAEVLVICIFLCLFEVSKQLKYNNDSKKSSAWMRQL